MSKRKELCSGCGGNRDYRAKLCMACAGVGITERLFSEKSALVLSNKDKANTISGIAELSGVSRKFAKRVLLSAGFDFSNLRPYRGRMPEAKHVLFRGTTRRNSTVLAYVRRHNLLDDLCSECGLIPEWNGKYLKLQLDHIDGDPCNNELTNLRILCPNCHTQTDTFTGRNKNGREAKLVHI